MQFFYLYQLFFLFMYARMCWHKQLLLLMKYFLSCPAYYGFYRENIFPIILRISEKIWILYDDIGDNNFHVLFTSLHAILSWVSIESNLIRLWHEQQSIEHISVYCQHCFWCYHALAQYTCQEKLEIIEKEKWICRRFFVMLLLPWYWLRILIKSQSHPVMRRPPKFLPNFVFKCIWNNHKHEIVIFWKNKFAHILHNIPIAD